MSTIDILVGRRMSERRRRLGLSEEDLASELGVIAAEVTGYENGSLRPDAGVLVDIARVLQVPLSHFFNSNEANA